MAAVGARREQAGSPIGRLKTLTVNANRAPAAEDIGTAFGRCPAGPVECGAAWTRCRGMAGTIRSGSTTRASRPLPRCLGRAIDEGST